jgi:hypothetical protein
MLRLVEVAVNTDRLHFFDLVTRRAIRCLIGGRRRPRV